MGRIDLQVKIRGYRIELTEIESVLLQVPGVAAAVVDTFEPTEGQKELVGYYSLRSGAGTLDQDEITAPPARAAAALHGAGLPRAAGRDPDDPAGQGRPPGAAGAERRAAPAAPAGEHVAAGSDTEQVLADALARTLGVDTVSVDSQLLRRPGRQLAAAGPVLRAGAQGDRAAVAVHARDLRQPDRSGSWPRCWATPRRPGAAGPARPGPWCAPAPPATGRSAPLQLLAFLGSAYLGALLLDHRARCGRSPGATTLEVVGRSAVFSAGHRRRRLRAADPGQVAADRPVLEPREIRLVEPGALPVLAGQDADPGQPAGRVRRFAGLQHVPARAGREDRPGRHHPVRHRPGGHRPDHHRRGHDHPPGLVVHRATGRCAGKIQIGPVTIGRDVFVGEKTALDIDTAIGDGAQLGHTSSLHTGQHIPAGERWHGVPAEPTTVDYRVIAPAPGGRLAPVRLRRAAAAGRVRGGPADRRRRHRRGHHARPAKPAVQRRHRRRARPAAQPRASTAGPRLITAVPVRGRRAERPGRDDRRAAAAAACWSGPGGPTRSTGSAGWPRRRSPGWATPSSS